jgi:hypothetical protein
MGVMAILKFELSKTPTILRVKIASDVQERLGRYRAFCGTHEHAGLVEHALVYVMDKDADCRARDKDGAVTPAKGAQRWSVTWVSPADKAGVALYFFCHT